MRELIRKLLREQSEDFNTTIEDHEDGFDVFIMDGDKKIGEISFTKESIPNLYTIVDATIDDEYKGNRIYPKTIINLFKERPNLIINSVFRSPEAEKSWRYILNNLPPNIGKSFKHYKEENTTLIQLKLLNLQENIQRIREMMGLVTETRQGLFNWLIEKLPNFPEYVIRDWVYKMIKQSDDINTYEGITEWIDSELKDLNWEYQKDFPMSMDIFTDKTKKELESRMQGEIMQYVDKDSERHETQKKLLQSVGISQEPIILFRTKDGKYELGEGWHRTTQTFIQYPDGFIQPKVYIGLNAKWLD